MTPAASRVAQMRAAVVEAAGVLAVRDVAIPDIGDDEALVEVAYCGVCGTDLHGILDGWVPVGTVPGHEWSGRVAAVGRAVSGLRPGDPVVGGPVTCGRCRWCRVGRPALCAADPMRGGSGGHGGAFAEYLVTSASALSRVPEGLDDRTAALAEPLAVALHGLTTAGITDADRRVLVTGAGPLGLLVVAALVARGIHDVTVSEPSGSRRTQAVAAGARGAVTPEDLPPVPALPTQCAADGYDVAFECSGQAAAIAQALGLLAPAGRLVLLGVHAMSVRLDPVRILTNELTVAGAYCYDQGGIDDALALLATGRLPVDVLVGPDDVPLEELLSALHRLRAGELARKVLVRP